MSETSIQVFNNDRRIFWRKVYTFSAISFLSLFVILWTHFGHYFGINDDNFVDFIEFNKLDFVTNITEENLDSFNNSIDEIVNQTNSLDQVVNETSIDQNQDEFNDTKEVNEDSESEVKDQDIIEPIKPKITFEDAWVTISDKLKHLSDDQAQIKDKLLNVDSKHENIENSLNDLKEKVNLIDDTLLEIRDEMTTIKDTLIQILDNQAKISTQQSSPDTNKKDKKKK